MYKALADVHSVIMTENEMLLHPCASPLDVLRASPQSPALFLDH